MLFVFLGELSRFKSWGFCGALISPGEPQMSLSHDVSCLSRTMTCNYRGGGQKTPYSQETWSYHASTGGH